MKKALLYIVAIIIIGEGFFLLNSYIYNKVYTEREKPMVATTTISTHHKDAEYIIDGKRIKLVNGVSEIETAPESASKIITKYFGNEVAYDLNKDGRNDVVFLLTQEGSGSGVFYYVVAALNTKDGYVGSEGFLLGDRIAPQTTAMSKEAGKNDVVVNYADRTPGEPFTTPPSIGKSVWLTLDTQTLRFSVVPEEILEETDPSTMTLDMKTWKWVTTTYEGGKEIAPRTAGEFTIKFLGKKLSTFSATTDCNNVGGKFSVTATDSTAEDPSITFSDIFATKKYCANAQESEFTQMLSSAGQFHFTSRGELIIEVNFGTGTMIFR